MRIKAKDLDLLGEIYSYLICHGEFEMSDELDGLIDRLEAEQEEERTSNRQRAAKNRAAVYAWESSYHPKRSKYWEGNGNGRIY